MTIDFLLPQELVDATLDCFKGDFSSLKVCCLVCRAWVPRSRSYLFEKCSLVPGNILVFRDLLQSPCCSFILHIRNISITREYAHPNDYCFNEIAADLRRLINIRTLRMQLSIFVDGINADAVFHTGFFMAFPHVTHLTLACSFLGDYLPPPPLVSVLSMFPALQTLCIRQSYSAVEELPTGLTPPRGLRSLELGRGSVYPTLAWLNAVGHPPTVNSITLPLLLPRDGSTVRAALQQLGGALHHLDVTCFFGGSSDYQSAYICTLF